MARHAVAHAAAATAQAFHARTTASAREETSAVVLSPASRWTSKMMKGMWMVNKGRPTSYLLVICTCMYRPNKNAMLNKSIQIPVYVNFSKLFHCYARIDDKIRPQGSLPLAIKEDR